MIKMRGSQQRLTDLYGRSLRWFGPEERGGVLDGVWLSLLADETLVRINERLRGRSARIQDVESRRGLYLWEQRAIDEYFSGAESVIVTYAGGGREVLALCGQGRLVRGFEPHAELARLASRSTEADGYGSCVIPGRRDEWPAAGQRADAVIVGERSYSAIPGRERRIRHLRGAALSLPVGAPILLSFSVRPPCSGRWRRAVRVARLLDRRGPVIPVELGDTLCPNRVHFFTFAEIEKELAAAGFDMVDYGEGECGWAVGRRTR